MGQFIWNVKQIKTNTLPFVRGLACFICNNILCFTLAAADLCHACLMSVRQLTDIRQIRAPRIRASHWSVAASAGLWLAEQSAGTVTSAQCSDQTWGGPGSQPDAKCRKNHRNVTLKQHHNRPGMLSRYKYCGSPCAHFPVPGDETPSHCELIY